MMKSIINSVKLPVKQITYKAKPGELEYPLYPVNEDIYNQLQKKDSIDTEYLTAAKTYAPDNKTNDISETVFITPFFANDLYFPGTGRDDKQG